MATNTIDATTTDAASAVTFLHVLEAYDHVLEQHEMIPEQDIFYYQTLLRMNIDPEMDWWRKFDSECSRLERISQVSERLRAVSSNVPASPRSPHASPRAFTASSALSPRPQPQQPQPQTQSQPQTDVSDSDSDWADLEVDTSAVTPVSPTTHIRNLRATANQHHRLLQCRRIVLHWYHITQYAHRELDLQKQAIRARTYLSQQSALRKWNAIALASQQRRRLLARATYILQLRRAASALCTWNAFVSQRKQNRRKEYAVSQHRQLVIKHTMFARWTERLRDRRRRRDNIVRAREFRIQSLKSHTYATWHKHLQYIHELRHRYSSTTVDQRLLHRSLCHWRQATATQQHDNRARLRIRFLLWRHRARKVRTLTTQNKAPLWNSALVRWISYSLDVDIERIWLDDCKSSAHLFKKHFMMNQVHWRINKSDQVHEAIQRTRAVRLRMSFNRLLRATRQTRQVRQDAQIKLQQRIARVEQVGLELSSLMQQRQRLACFNIWRRRTARYRRAQIISAELQQNRRVRHLAHMFGNWGKAASIVQRIRVFRLCNTIRRWAGVAATQKQFRHRSTGASTSIQLLRKTRTIATWHKHAHRTAHQRAVIAVRTATVHRRLGKAFTRRAVHHWLQHVFRTKADAMRMRVAHHLNKKFALARWKSALATHKAMVRESTLRNSKAKAFASKSVWRAQALSRAIVLWHARSRKRIHCDKLLRQAGRLRHLQSCKRMLLHWKSTASASRKQRTLLGMAEQYRIRRIALEGVRSWQLAALSTRIRGQAVALHQFRSSKRAIALWHKRVQSYARYESRACEKFQLRRDSLRTQQCWKIWRRLLRIRLVARRAVDMCEYVSEQSRKRRLLIQWKSKTISLYEFDEVRAQRSFEASSMIKLRVCFNVWHQRLQAIQRSNSRATSYLGIRMRILGRKALLSWREATAVQQQHSSGLSIPVRQAYLRATRAAFDLWRTRTTEMTEAEKADRHRVFTLLRSHTWKWKRQVWTSHKAREAANNALYHRRCTKLRNAIQHWHWCAALSKAIKTIRKRTLHAKLRQGIITWGSHVQQQRESRRTHAEHSAMARTQLRHARLFRFVGIWKANARRSASSNRMLRVAADKFKDRELNHIRTLGMQALEQWSSQAVHSRQRKALHVKAVTFYKRSVIRHWSDVALLVQLRRRQNIIATHMAVTIRRKHAFHEWRQNVENVTHARHLVRVSSEVVKSAQTRVALRAWHTWLSQTITSDRHRYTHVVQLRRNRIVSRALSIWYESLEASRMRRALLLQMCWKRWLRSWQFQQAFASSFVRLDQHRMRAAIRKLLASVANSAKRRETLSMSDDFARRRAIEEWKDVVFYRQTIRDTVASYQRSHRLDRLGLSIVQWKTAACGSRHQRQLLDRAQYSANSLAIDVRQRTAIHHWKCLTVRRSTLNRCADGVAWQRATRLFRAWYIASRRSRACAKLDNVVDKCMIRVYAWPSLCSFTIARRLESKAVSRTRSLFELQWVDVLDQCTLIARVGRKFNPTRSHFLAWMVYTRRQRRLHQLAEKLMASRRQTIRMRTWKLWRNNATAQTLDRNASAQFELFCKRRALDKLAAFAVDRVDSHERTAVAAGHWARVQCNRGVNILARHAVKQQSDRAKQAHLVRSIARHWVVQGLRHWKRVTTRRVRGRHRHATANAFRRQKLERRSFEFWKSLAVKRWRINAAYQEVSRHHRTAMLHDVFQFWHARCTRIQRSQLAMTREMSRYRVACMRRAFLAWRQRTYTHRERDRYFVLTQIFSRWKLHVKRLYLVRSLLEETDASVIGFT
jgi:hypothetical protein